MKKLYLLTVFFTSSAYFASAADCTIDHQKFSTNWFTKDNWDNYTPKSIKGKRCLEIGSFEGRSTTYMATNYCDKVDVIDTFEGSFEHNNDLKNSLLEKFKFNMKCFIDKGIVTPYIGQSSKYLVEFVSEVQNNKRQKYDYVYIDGSHFAKDVLLDAVLSWEILNDGGMMIFDDYKWEVFKNKYMIPSPAINGFLEAYQGLYEITFNQYQLHLRKTATHPTSENFKEARE